MGRIVWAPSLREPSKKRGSINVGAIGEDRKTLHTGESRFVHIESVRETERSPQDTMVTIYCRQGHREILTLITLSRRQYLHSLKTSPQICISGVLLLIYVQIFFDTSSQGSGHL